MASCDEVEQCLRDDKDTLKRYRRFLKTKVDPSLRECPDCQRFCKPSVDEESGRPLPAILCDGCGAEFCYYHAAAHRGQGCEEYEVRLAAETKGISESFGAKDCPRCLRQTLKSGGCNHMTCQVCRCDWCWICNQQLVGRGPHGEGPVFWHYSEENVESGCQQFAEAGAHPNTEEVRLRRRDRTPGPLIKRASVPVGLLSVALLAIAALLALVLWMLLYFVCGIIAGVAKLVVRGCYWLSRIEPPDALGEVGAQRLVKYTLYFAIGLGMVTFLVPFLALWLIWNLVALVLWALLATFGRLPLLRRCLPQPTFAHLRFLFAAPGRAVQRSCSTLFAHLVGGAPGFERDD